jgi:hypothetical protein
MSAAFSNASPASSIRRASSSGTLPNFVAAISRRICRCVQFPRARQLRFPRQFSCSATVSNSHAIPTARPPRTQLTGSARRATRR